jgi:dTDP-4-dehydrorhamnose reductase
MLFALLLPVVVLRGADNNGWMGMIALAGAHSVLARHILPALRSSHQVFAFDSSQGDIWNIDFLKNFIDEVQPHIFVNCSEFSDLEQCEFFRDRTYEHNAWAAGELARLCGERDILLIHFSSSFIFDGESSIPYTEDAVPRPIQTYGDSKLLSEKLIIASGCRHMILRVPHVYGSGDSFLHRILQELRSQRDVQVTRGLIVSPLYAEDAAGCLVSLLQAGAEGLFHVGGDGAVDMASFVAEARSVFHSKTGEVLQGIVVEVDYDDYPSPFEYPLYNVLSSEKISLVTERKPHSWNQSLARFIDTWSHEI